MEAFRLIQTRKDLITICTVLLVGLISLQSGGQAKAEKVTISTNPNRDYLEPYFASNEPFELDGKRYFIFVVEKNRKGVFSKTVLLIESPSSWLRTAAGANIQSIYVSWEDANGKRNERRADISNGFWLFDCKLKTFVLLEYTDSFLEDSSSELVQYSKDLLKSFRAIQKGNDSDLCDRALTDN